MIAYTSRQITRIVDGKLFSPPSFQDKKIEQVVTDSRSFFNPQHAMFFALIGPRNNGHQYIPGLMERGMNVFLVSRHEFISGKACFILVANTTEALQKLAAHHRSCFNFPVIGITGSNGKTVVKEWLFELCLAEFRIVRSPKSYNSQVGVPLSVLQMDAPFNLGIFEAGISKPGEMAKLAAVVQPEIGILTNIGDAHQENFESKQQKTTEKLELFKNAAKLVFCTDDEETAALIAKFCAENMIEPVGWTTESRTATISFKKTVKKSFTEIETGFGQSVLRVQIPLTDKSSIENACHCFAVILLLSKNPAEILPRFRKLAPVAMRLEIKQGTNNSLLINDFYNSDLTSLSIALSVLHQQAKKSHLKKQVILSDIQRTGLSQTGLYRQVNHLLEQWNIDELKGIGPEISRHSRLFTVEKRFFESTGDFEKSLARNDFKDSAVLIKGARSFKFERISALLQQKAHQTVLEINLNALVHNLNIFRSLLRPSTKIMVMVKAFSYGSGDVEIAKLLQYQHVDYLAVAVADEGTELRQAGIQTPVIVMNPEAHSFQNLIESGLEPSIYSMELLAGFEKEVAGNALRNYPVHLKIDTGMNRLGFKTKSEVEEVVSFLKKTNYLKVVSVFSHLAGSDDPQFDHFTKQQFSLFDQLSKEITSHFPHKIDRHILNSAGIERFPEKQMEMVRLGIGLYGVSATNLPLETISTFKSVVSQVKRLEPGETVGYSRKGTISRETGIAVVPVGYADGLDRKLGNRNGEAFINGRRVPVIGNICMDMLMLDVTGVDVRPGDEVEFFGPNISITEVAAKAGTIPYEILTGISQRVKRVYLQE